MTSGLFAGFEAYVTEGRERTSVMTCLCLFSSRSCHSQGSKQKEKSQQEAPGVTRPGRACCGVAVTVFTREDSDPVSLPSTFSFKISRFSFDLTLPFGCQAPSRSQQAPPWASTGHGPATGLRLSSGIFGKLQGGKRVHFILSVSSCVS